MPIARGLGREVALAREPALEDAVLLVPVVPVAPMLALALAPALDLAFAGLMEALFVPLAFVPLAVPLLLAALPVAAMSRLAAALIAAGALLVSVVEAAVQFTLFSTVIDVSIVITCPVSFFSGPVLHLRVRSTSTFPNFA